MPPAMSQDDKQPDYPGERAADEEIEILEVVGMDEDGEPLPEPPRVGDRLTLAFDDGPAPDRPADRGAPRHGGPGPLALDPERQLAQIRADYENLRKRIERERREYEEHANSTLVARLLPVLDNFERALAVLPGGETDAAFRQGVQLIYKHLRDELRREGLQTIEAAGRPFDPSVHDAVATESGPHDGTLRVVEELQRGYLFRNRLLRPAQVKVVLGGARGSGTEEDG